MLCLYDFGCYSILCKYIWLSVIFEDICMLCADLALPDMASQCVQPLQILCDSLTILYKFMDLYQGFYIQPYFQTYSDMMVIKAYIQCFV